MALVGSETFLSQIVRTTTRSAFSDNNSPVILSPLVRCRMTMGRFSAAMPTLVAKARTKQTSKSHVVVQHAAIGFNESFQPLIRPRHPFPPPRRHPWRAWECQSRLRAAFRPVVTPRRLHPRRAADGF